MLGSNPGAATYNVAVDTVRMHSHKLWTSLQAAEMAYLVSKVHTMPACRTTRPPSLPN